MEGSMEDLRKSEVELGEDSEPDEPALSEPDRESIEEKRKRLPTSLPVGGIITPV
jgi:hypothetical protein